MFYAHLMNMHFFTSYLSSKPGLNCLKAAALEFNCQIVHFMIVLPKKTYISKISIKHVFSTIFSTVLELLQTVYREKTELQVVTNHSVHR